MLLTGTNVTVKINACLYPSEANVLKKISYPKSYTVFYRHSLLWIALFSSQGITTAMGAGCQVLEHKLHFKWLTTLL